MRSPITARLVAVTLAAAVVATLSSCTTAGGQPDKDAVTQSVLRYVKSDEPSTLNPVKASIGDASTWGSMFDRIIAIDDKLQPTADGLVTKWESTDANTWRFTVRDGIEFHNGERWDVDALKFSLEEYRDNESSVVKNYLAKIADVVVVDENTVDVISSSPNAAIPNVLSTLWALPPDYYTEKGEEEFARTPVGTGPFVFGSNKAGIAIEVTANEDYWRGRPKLDGLRFTWAPDESTRLALLQSGDADVVESIGVRSAAELKGSDEFEVSSVASLRSLNLFLNDARPPFDDPVLREAVVRAIDRQAIIDSVFEGTGATPTTGFLSPFNSSITEPKDLYDPDRARKLIASMQDVPTIPLHFHVGRTISDGDVAELVAGMLENVGLKVERDPQEYSNLVTLIRSGTLSGMFDWSLIPAYPHPNSFASAFVSPTASISKSCTSDPRLDALTTEGVAEVDLKASAALYSEMDRLVTSELFCIVPLYHEVRQWGVSTAVTSFTARADTVPDWFEAAF